MQTKNEILYSLSCQFGIGSAQEAHTMRRHLPPAPQQILCEKMTNLERINLQIPTKQTIHNRLIDVWDYSTFVE